jgi:hypothetical protein
MSSKTLYMESFRVPYRLTHLYQLRDGSSEAEQVIYQHLYLSIRVKANFRDASEYHLWPDEKRQLEDLAEAHGYSVIWFDKDEDIKPQEETSEDN